MCMTVETHWCQVWYIFRSNAPLSQLSSSQPGFPTISSCVLLHVLSCFPLTDIKVPKEIKRDIQTTFFQPFLFLPNKCYKLRQQLEILPTWKLSRKMCTFLFQSTSSGDKVCSEVNCRWKVNGSGGHCKTILFTKAHPVIVSSSNAQLADVPQHDTHTSLSNLDTNSMCAVFV